MSRPPAWEIREQKLEGAPYTCHSLYVRGVCIASRLSPFSDAELAELVRAHVAPSAPVYAGPPRELRYGKKGKS